jgi:hypothetical protein
MLVTHWAAPGSIDCFIGMPRCEMRYELRLHRLLLAMLVTLLALFVIALLYLNSHFGEEHLEAILSLIVVIAVATVFAYMGLVEGVTAFYFGTKHRREFIVYLLLALVSLSSALYLAMSQDEPLQRVSLVAAPHAFLFGLAELRIARGMERHPRERRALIVCGCCELLLGFALVWGSMLPSVRVAEILGVVACVTLVQLLPMLFYRPIPGVPQSRAHL